MLTRIADDDAHLQALFDLDNATNERLLAENNLLAGIGVDELVFAVPHYRIINAAFTHAHPLGSRFNGPDRGAWYAGFELETAQAEIAWYKSVELAEVSWFEERLSYDDYVADFGGHFHDMRDNEEFASCLAPESYEASQLMAATLLDTGSSGIVYPSVRRTDGTCLACFRPALVANLRKGERFCFTWSGSPHPTIEISNE